MLLAPPFLSRAVTFRRKPASWQAVAGESAAEAAAAPAAGGSGLAAWAFLASLFVAVAGNIISERQGLRMQQRLVSTTGPHSRCIPP